MTNRNFTNFNEFLNIRYIRSVKGIYMNPSDFDYMIERFKKISEENDKLKAEIEQLKWKLSSVETQRDLKGYDAKRNADIMRSQLKIIEQLKSELEQLSKQYCNVESMYHKYYNLYKKGQVEE